MTKFEATTLAQKHEFPLGEDFHSLTSDVVKRIIDAANEVKYRKPPLASGSRARSFYAAINRSVRSV